MRTLYATPQIRSAFTETVEKSGRRHPLTLETYGETATMTEDNLVTRAELAAFVGVTEEYIRRKERLGLLKPEKRGKQNQPFYNKEAAANVLRGRPGEVKWSGFNKVPYQAADAKRVFGLIRKGTSLFDIVMELEMHPDMVRTIAHDSAEMEGGLIVSGSIMRTINSLDLDGNFPLTSGEDLLDLLQGCSDKSCSHCGKHPKSICKQCAPAVTKKMEF